MTSSCPELPVFNEPILGYMAGSKERVALEVNLAKYSGECEKPSLSSLAGRSKN